MLTPEIVGMLTKIHEFKGEQNLFIEVPAWETPNAIDELCKAFDETVQEDIIDPLIVIPMFVLDFLCIHPFNDGNGRIIKIGGGRYTKYMWNWDKEN